MQDFDLENQLIQNRLRKFQSQGYEAPQGKMVGRHFIAPNALQHIAAGLRGYGAIQGEQQATQELKDLRNRRQETEALDMSAFVSALRGTPENAPSPDFEGNAVGPTMPAKPGDPMAAYSLAAASQSPTVRQMGMQGIAQMPQMEAQKQERIDARQFRQTEAELARQARSEEAAANREQRMRELQMRSEDQRLSQQERIAAQRESRDLMMQNQREMAKLQASLRPEKMVTVLGPNGEALTLPQSQAQGQGIEIYNPLRAKQLQTEQGKKVGQSALSETLDSLADRYNKLNQNSGIPSQTNRVGTNLAAAASSTPLGNFAGRMLGTENADARDFIAQTRPLLLADIKKATGMTASEMNSNVEMQMWLSAATDPTKGYEANMDAIRNLENKFGLGRGKGEKTNPFSPKPAAAQPRQMSAQDAEAEQWARSNPNDPRSRAILQRLGQ